jgi:Protein of unknown function (DUF4238)
MAAHHYISKFHLRAFCDPAGLSTPDPWLWIGDLSDGSVKRRAPKNVGTWRDLFAGPGGLVDEQASLESFLAENVEGPAAQALRKITNGTAALTQMPPEIMRYLAWAASRCLPMQRLEIQWALRFPDLLSGESVIEPPPSGLTDTAPRVRSVALLHPSLGEKTTEAGEDLRPPAGSYFIIGDRPVGWGVRDCLDAPPCCLRDPSAFLIAPLSRELVLVGRNNSESWEITPREVNHLLATWSYDWIAGPTEDVVKGAIRDRQESRQRFN